MSVQNAVQIHAGGHITPNEGAEGEALDEEAVSLDIYGTKSVSIESGSVIKMTAPVVDFSNVRAFRYGAQETYSVSSGKAITTDTTDIKEIATGSKQTVVSGPSDLNPLNPQGISEKVNTSPATGCVGGTVKEETVFFGDVERTTTTTGDRTTTVNAGDITHRSILGSVVSKSALNEIALNPDSISVKATLGSVEINSIVGKVSISSKLGVDVTSVGPVNITGSSILLTGKAGTPVGGTSCVALTYTH